MKLIKTNRIEVTTSDVLAWLREKFPDVPPDCDLETRVVQQRNEIVGGQSPDACVVLVVKWGTP